MNPNTSANSSVQRSSLVHEVNDSFDFDQKLFQTDLTVSIQGNSSLLGGPSNIRKSSIEPTNANLNNSPTTNTASYFNANFDENGYVFDGIKIDIDDIDNTSISNITTQSLKRCKSQVLKHYYTLLCFIGWRPFYKEHYYRTPWFCKIFNILYPLLIIALLFYSYAYDIKTCQGKLNVAYDTQYVPPQQLVTSIMRTKTTKTQETQENSTLVLSNILGFFTPKLEENNKPNLTIELEKKKKDPMCGHIVTTYILPSLLHLVAYILGFVYFRINENEQLYALMEKVFLAVNQTFKMVSQDRVIKRLKIFILLGVLWVILAMSLYMLSIAAFGYEDNLFGPNWASILVETVALVIVNSIYLAVVINHATQCEMILFYVNEVKTRLEEKSVTLKEAMQQILDIRMAIGNLNSTASKMTTLVALIFIEKFIIGLIILIMNRVFTPLAWIYRVLFTFSWFLIISFILIQVARLNSKCSKFKQIALSARVYGYHASNRDELDSFLLFVSNAKLRSKLFGVPLKPSLILGSLIIITFTIIILFQTSVITTPDSFI